MEDEGGVKARLRRRLSVEQSDDAKSSSAPSTPTKKRGGRRAAKPELDLIDENAPENDTTKKITRKANMKELEIDEKPLTPSRRSARIKSNTSIVLETTQTVDSPRAKRASRRTSQAGSDNEAPLTPARPTRRTRKDSANADKADPQPTNKPITEIIVEEPETSSQKSLSNAERPGEQSHSPSGLRKSPRLSLKNNKVRDSIELNEKEKDNSEKLNNNKSLDSTESNDKEIHNPEEYNSSNKNELFEDKEITETKSPLIKPVDIRNSVCDGEHNILSKSNIELLQDLNTQPMRKERNLNKSSSALMDTQTQCFKYKRHRTKSWTTLCEPVENVNKYYSDSESIKKIKKNLINNSNQADTQNVSIIVNDGLNVSSNKKKKSILNTSVKEVVTDLIDSPNSMGKTVSPSEIGSATTNLFNKEPTNDMQTLVYIDESDSNSEKNNIHNKVKDECVQRVQTCNTNQETNTPPQIDEFQNIINNSQGSKENRSIKNNDSCEPMDIDETIPDNIMPNKSPLKTLDISENNISSKGKVATNCSGNEKDKSWKSNLTSSTSQTPDKIPIENKSTLILSQLKDISNENSVSQSPQIASEKKLSNSDQTQNFSRDNEVDKKNFSVNYSTSTPLQERSFLKRAIQVNASGINSNNTSKIDKSPNKSIKHVSITNKSNNSSEESMSYEESSQEKSNFEDDEAEDAGDDYESGDSRDEEEEQYEREHEIIQKGETLTSEDELSNDSDYEKDSFIVSSDEEDAELLDGSGDDLSMSDNELKMTAQSKKKYNERKVKEQKKASKEMFESRHKSNMSHKRNKSDLTKITKNRAISDSSNSDIENPEVKIKKNKRMRLDSSQDSSVDKSLDNKFENLNKSLTKSGHNESVTNEVEMSVIADVKQHDIDPLSIEIKKEPKTPQKETMNTSIQFIDTQFSKKKDGDSNKSQLNMTPMEDPLEDSNSSESSISNNGHIQNYDSVLKDLNKSMKTNKNVKGDISLNLKKNTKQKSIPIVDQLNLTQIKLKKKFPVNKDSKNKSPDNEETFKNSNKYLTDIHKSVSKNKSINKNSDNESSDSIDLHLLFSEDSNNSENVEIEHQEDEQNNEDDSFIPLKKCHGKTDMFRTSGSNDTSFTENTKKMKRQNKSLDRSNIENKNEVDEPEVQFFLDTTGTHDSKTIDKSFNLSSTKGRKEKHMAVQREDSDSDAPMEVSNKSVKETQSQQIDVDENLELNNSKIKTPKSDRKKKRTSESQTKELTDSKENQLYTEDLETKTNKSDAADRSVNKSQSKTPKSERKKSKRTSESQSVEPKDKTSNSDASMEILNKSQRETESHVHQDDIEEVANTSLKSSNKSISKTPKSDKKKKRTSVSQTSDITDANDNQLNIEEDNVEKVNYSGTADRSANSSVSKTPKSEKKKAKRISESETEKQKGEQDTITKRKSAVEELQDYQEEQEPKTGVEDTSVNKVVIKTPKSDKKKKTFSESETGMSSTINKTSSSEKKNLKNILEFNDNIDNVTENSEVGTKKRKRKSSLNQIEKEPESQGLTSCNTSKPNNNISTVTISQHKKRKISHNNEDSVKLDQAPTTKIKMTPMEKQQSQDMDTQQHRLENKVNNNKKDNTDTYLNKKKETKKRKEREDDDGSKIAKVLKVDTNKIQVPRLPPSLLIQLEDRPKKKNHEVTKSKAISTTNFVVEETKLKKPKPSNYLEESVYLNEDETINSKKQKRIKNPKVLPFLPTVSTSNSGYTTDFKVNILPKEIQFVAKSTNITNYKNDYLQNKKIKRLGTYELYKRNRTIKMSKF